MFVLMQVIHEYGPKVRKRYLVECSTRAVVCFNTRAEAEAVREQLDGGDVMYLGHNQCSNRIEVRRLRSNQLASPKFANMVPYSPGMCLE